MKKNVQCSGFNVQDSTKATLNIEHCTLNIAPRTLHPVHHTLNKLFFVSLIILFSSVVVYGQEEEGGEIENVEIEIVKEKQITMPKASRNFEKIPPRPADPLAPAMTYDFKTINFAAPDYNPIVKPLRLKDETLSKIYGNYLSAGFGNYNSPFLRGSISSKRDAEKYYGVDFFHHSFNKGPVDGKNSGMGYSKVNGYFSGMGPKVTADLGLTYENLFNHFYGYGGFALPQNPAESDIRQTYNIIGLNAAFSNTKAADFNYKLAADFSYLYDRFDASESDAGLHFNSRYKVNGTQAFLFKTDYSLIARKDSKVEAKPRHLFKINPAYEFVIAERFRLSAGVNAVVENDSIGKNKPVHIYPDVWAHTEIAKSVDVYAGITGDYEKVSLHTLARENQWIAPNVDIFHTNKSFEFRGGVQGKVIRKVSFNFGTSIINFKHLYFYQNLASDPTKFDVVYDDAVRLNLFGELGIAHSDKVSVNLRGDYYSYTMNHLAYAWQRPTYKVGFYSSYKIFDKVLLTVNLGSQGGAKAFDYKTDNVVTLKSIVNLDAKLRYFISKRWSAYIEANNILNVKYPIYQYYPAKGLQMSAGVSWSF
jgi:hypothetical protein